MLNSGQNQNLKIMRNLKKKVFSLSLAFALSFGVILNFISMKVQAQESFICDDDPEPYCIIVGKACPEDWGECCYVSSEIT